MTLSPNIRQFAEIYEHDEQSRLRFDRTRARFIGALVAMATGVEPHAIHAPQRATMEAALARQIAMYLAHTVFSWSMSRVGAAFDRDRTTASHACHRVEDLRDDAQFDSLLLKLELCARAAPLYPQAKP
jgi:chromosomal replication initiation ATPase DnaA